MEPNKRLIPREGYTLERRIAAVPLREFVPAFVDVDRFLAQCRACPNYGTRWSCPPFSFDPLELWASHDALCLVALTLTPAPGTRREALLEHMRREKAALLEDLLTLESRMPGSLALAAGSCELCRFCSRREGDPCRRPNRLRTSLEALGADVEGAAARYLDTTLRWTAPGEAPAPLTLVGGLLLPLSALPKGGPHG